MCENVPDEKALSVLMEDAKFDVYEWQQLASPVWMDINQGNVLRRVKAVNDEKHVCPLQLDTIANLLPFICAFRILGFIRHLPFSCSARL